MFDKKLVDSVVAIILHHTQPDRIWLFGSRITGDADERSDYDFALDDATDPDGVKLDKIRSEIEILPTLHKIDISNIHKAETRFANREKWRGYTLVRTVRHSSFNSEKVKTLQSPSLKSRLRGKSPEP